MAVDKVLSLVSGGTLVLSLERVNVFTLTEPEQSLMAEIAAAVRKYERRASGEQAAVRKDNDDKETV